MPLDDLNSSWNIYSFENTLFQHQLLLWYTLRKSVSYTYFSFLVSINFNILSKLCILHSSQIHFICLTKICFMLWKNNVFLWSQQVEVVCSCETCCILPASIGKHCKVYCEVFCIWRYVNCVAHPVLSYKPQLSESCFYEIVFCLALLFQKTENLFCILRSWFL